MALFVIHGIWGLVLWFSISKLGLGLSTDSVHLLFGGLNLSEGHRLISFDNSPLLDWPPLYPVLLGGMHALSGMSTFAAANLLQGLGYAALAICLSLLWLRIFPDSFALAVAASVLSNVGVVAVITFDLLGSDYVHFVLAMLVVLLAGYYVERQSGWAFVALSLAGMLAMLDRYLGIAAIATAVACVLLFTRGGPGQRALRGLVVGTGVLPAGLWLWMTSPYITRRDPISFGENFRWFSQSVLEWFLRTATIEQHLARLIVGLWILIVALIVVIAVVRGPAFPPAARPLLLFGLFYLLALFGSASMAFFNKPVDRFVLPLYVPFVGLGLLGARGMLEIARRAAGPLVYRTVAVGLFAAMAVAAVLMLQVSAPAIQQSHDGVGDAGENAFNTTDWRANTALQFWQMHQPKGDYLLFSNESDGVAFYTMHNVSPSPRQYSGPYGKVEFPVSQYGVELFGSGKDVYLVWIEQSEHAYYYKPEALAPIADIETIFSGPDGGIYRLRPKAGGQAPGMLCKMPGAM